MRNALWILLVACRGSSTPAAPDAAGELDAEIDASRPTATCAEATSWTVAVTRDGTTDEGADAHAALAPDCSTLLTIADPFSPVRFDGTVLSGPHLARIGADGNVVRIVPTGAQTYGMTVAVDAQNRPVVVWGSSEGLVVGYDADLEVRWQRPIGLAVALAFALGANGNVALLDRNAAGTVSVLRYLDGAGAPRWSIDANVAHLRMLANDDVVAYLFAQGGPRRVVYAAADGEILDDRPTVMPTVLTADGEGLLAGFVDNTTVFLERHDRDGVRSWRIEFAGNAPPDLVVGPDGVIAALTRPATPTPRLLRLDPLTGAELSALDAVGGHRLVGADATGGVALGLIGSPSIGVARFTPAK